MIVWAFRGRAYLKRKIAQCVILDPATLPYRSEVLSFLQNQKNVGQTLVLATASDYQPAEAIATHLGLFSHVLASDGVTNLSGRKKAEVLEARFGKGGFDYIGDSTADLAVWPSTHHAILVNPSQKLMAQTPMGTSVDKMITRESHPLHILGTALRVRQWMKNSLLFLPLVAAHQFFDVQQCSQVGLAFAAFSLCASGIYLFNDLMDLQADRRHPKKKCRPLACGDLSILHAFLFIPILLTTGFGLSLFTLSHEVSALLAVYVLTTISYSFFLKQTPILDVLILAGLYTIRVIAGGLAAGITISAWLFAFSMFFFLSLAIRKRHGELQFRKVGRFQGLERRGYVGEDKEALCTMGIVSGYLSILVLALYINSKDIMVHYQQPQILWLLCPLLFYWISRTWLLGHRECVNDDPFVVALKDPQSYVVAAGIGLFTFLAI